MQHRHFVWIIAATLVVAVVAGVIGYICLWRARGEKCPKCTPCKATTTSSPNSPVFQCDGDGTCTLSTRTMEFVAEKGFEARLIGDDDERVDVDAWRSEPGGSASFGSGRLVKNAKGTFVTVPMELHDKGRAVNMHSAFTLGVYTNENAARNNGQKCGARFNWSRWRTCAVADTQTMPPTFVSPYPGE